jgi:hypothetical protein
MALHSFAVVSSFFKCISAFCLGVVLSVTVTGQPSANQKQNSAVSSSVVFLKDVPPAQVVAVPSLTRIKSKPCFKNFTNYSTEDGLALSGVYCGLKDHQNNLWFGTHGAGVSKLDGTVLSNYDMSRGLPSNNVRKIFEDATGKVWIGTDGGVSVIDDKKITTFTTTDGLAHNRVWDILQDSKRNFWFGTFGGGVTVYDGKIFKTYTTKDGLSHNSILCLFEDRSGNIWIGGAGGGLTRFDGESFITITKAEGLPDETVYDIEEAEDASLWIGTNLGITNLSFISKTGEVFPGGRVATKNAFLRKQFNLQWDSYNSQTGHPIKDVNTNAMCIARIGLPKQTRSKGMIWIGCGDDKLIKFDPFSIGLNRIPPLVLLKNLKVNDTELCWSCFHGETNQDSARLAQQEMLTYGKVLSLVQRDTLKKSYEALTYNDLSKFTNLPEELRLPHKMNRVTFDFNAIETSRYFLVNYQYKLEGQDDRWSPPAKSTQATYSNLWEGDYVFKVRAQSAEGIWGEPIAYNFTVSAPWWRKPWMYLVYAALAVSLVAAIVKVRERELKTEKLALEEVVRERTNEVMAQMKTAELRKQEAELEKLEAERQRNLVEEKNSVIVKQLEDTEVSLTNLTLQMIQRYHAYGELEQEVRKLADAGDPAKYQRVFSMLNTNKSLDKEWEQFNLIYIRILIQNCGSVHHNCLTTIFGCVR